MSVCVRVVSGSTPRWARPLSPGARVRWLCLRAGLSVRLGVSDKGTSGV